MSSTYPIAPRSSFLAWCRSHQSIFVDRAEEIGLTAAQAEEFRVKTEEAIALESAYQSALSAAESAALAAKQGVEALRRSASDTVRTIRTFAVTTGDRGVYPAAGINPPKNPGTMPPPGTPYRMRFTLTASGAPEIVWRCDNPEGSTGTTYIVSRRLGSSEPWAFVGVTGAKRFNDDTLPAGHPCVEYRVQAHRGDRVGPVSHPLLVSFGVNGGAGGVTGVGAGSGGVAAMAANAGAIAGSRAA